MIYLYECIFFFNFLMATLTSDEAFVLVIGIVSLSDRRRAVHRTARQVSLLPRKCLFRNNDLANYSQSLAIVTSLRIMIINYKRIPF